MPKLDAVIVGSGPNGLAAAVALAQAGASVAVLESRDSIGGGTRTAELTEPGFLHDVCSGAHPMGILSPFFRSLPLHEHGLEWVFPAASVAHPLDDQPAVMLWRDLQRTCDGLGRDGNRYRQLIAPFLHNPQGFLHDAIGPLRIPKNPLTFGLFGALGMLPATWLTGLMFRGQRGPALFGGCAAHSILPLGRPLTSAIGLIFALTGHMENWPVARGGSAAITTALASYLESLGGYVLTDAHVAAFHDLPPARTYLFDTDPLQLASICEPVLPASYVRRLRRYRFGPGAFKVDWALDGPIPWKDKNCAQACTVHLGGTMQEIAESEAAVWRGDSPQRPFVLAVQQSMFDETRAPEGKHTGYAYCHVPANSTADMTEAIEGQVERFAPGFRDLIRARHTTGTAAFQRLNANYVGGAITGGVADIGQLFTRPVARLDPYSTPNPRVFLCSASTPPGGGVHGMCGYFAAQSALRRLEVPN